MTQPETRPLILLTNDDGVEAPGIPPLCRSLSSLGDLLLVFPRSERSATGHAIAIGKDLAYERIDIENGFRAHALDAAPADCVKLGLKHLAPRSPDLVVAGINRGANIGNNIFYSGTVAAAIEATLLGVPAIAVSLDCPQHANPKHYETAADFAKTAATAVLDRGLPERTVLNINVPNLPQDEIQGIVVSRQGLGMFGDHFEPIEENGSIRAYRNVGDRAISTPDDGEFDDRTLKRGMISITPLRCDLTHDEILDDLRRWFAQGGAR
ncbi:5'/3'-nucleotidase SurE [Candidatus Sumerlaeota bacterium]|nr:5'/3'-nucleotidase SurE [Candidatus Sumerlaeota bacterium]